MVIRRPKDGDRREVTRFLWLPRRFDGGWYWLETVTVRQVYLYYGTVLPGWEDVCLVADRAEPRSNERPVVRGTRPKQP